MKQIQPPAPVGRSVVGFYKEAGLKRDVHYRLPTEDRPKTVVLNGRPHVIESVEDWRKRIANRWSATSWVKAAGMSRRSYYNLAPEDRPHKNANGDIDEPPQDWWQRMARKQVAS